MEAVELSETTTGTAIREYLEKVGRGNPYSFFKIFRETKPTTSYASVRKYFWICRKIGLIRPAGFETRPHGWRKRFYEVVPENLNLPLWWHPQGEMYPGTLGHHFTEMKEKGLTPPSGRNPKYK